GKLDRLAEELAQPYLEGPGECRELIAGVVDVVLRFHRCAQGPEDPGERITNRGCAGIDDDERARGIRAHDLESRARPLLRLARAVARPRLQVLLERSGAPARAQKRVEKARPGTPDTPHRRCLGKVRRDRVRDLARCLTRLSSEG